MKDNMFEPKIKTVRLPLMEQQMIKELIKIKEERLDHAVQFSESEIIRLAIQYYHESYIKETKK